MQAEPNKVEPPKRKRRWFQFSLRTLLIGSLQSNSPLFRLVGNCAARQSESAALAHLKTNRKNRLMSYRACIFVLLVVLTLQAASVTQAAQVYAWGFNNYGQLGDGTTTNQTTPVAVNGLENATSIALGTFHSVALLSDGTVRT